MYQLVTFGGLFLERDGVPVDQITAYRKSLALLAVIAADRGVREAASGVGGGVSRERLTALLWPESDDEHARGSLKQAIHLLRRQLGEPGLVLGNAELRLNPERIESSVQLFLQGIRDSNLEEAVRHYRGPFLDGVHVSGAAEFERWAEERRTELALRYREALESLAHRAEHAGDATGSVKWWRRLQAADPFNGRVAVSLMQSLAASGDVAAAVRHARVHEVLLREELGMAPDEAVLELAALLGSGRTVARAGVAREAAGPVPRDDSDAPEAAPARAPRDLSAPPEPSPRMGGESAGEPPLVRRPGTGRRRRVVAATGVALAVLAAAIMGGQKRFAGLTGSGAEIAPAQSVALAVLPFADLSPEGDHEYFADGITEEILNELAQHPDLRVPARSTSFYFKAHNLPMREIASRLGVQAVLEGSVRKSGNRVRITAQLIDATHDRHLWSETFDRDLEDIFEVQSEIAAVVAQALRVRLFATEEQRVQPATTVEAHDLYLRGLFNWNRRSTQDLRLAIQFFEEAARRDPEYARPHAGLALAYAIMPIGSPSSIPVEEARERMEAAASRALELDSTLAEPHAARAMSYHFQWRWSDAEREFLRALELDPAYPTAHQWYGEHQSKTGRRAEAVESLRRAVALDPLSLVVNNDLALALLLNGQDAEAVEQFERTLRMDAGFWIPHYFLHRIHLLAGRLQEAEDAGKRWLDLTGHFRVEDINTLVRATRADSLRPAALAVLHRWEQDAHPRWLDIAFYRVAIGDNHGALAALERGLEARMPMMTQLGASRWFQPLQGDPRFERMLVEMGLK